MPILKAISPAIRQALLIAISMLLCMSRTVAQSTVQVDVCVYGATSAGVIAAYAAKKNNHSVILVDPGKHLGGLTSGGLGYTDIGNKYAVTGLGLDFYRRVGKHYGKFESWVFEPHVAHDVFMQYIRSAHIDMAMEHMLVNVRKQGDRITELELSHTDAGKKPIVKIIKAKMFIDCSYEGDLMAKAGVSYIVGREGNEQYHESYDGVQLRDKHQFPDGIDPYKIPGKPESGLLWGISSEPLAPHGNGDKKVQAYNIRLCLTDDPANRITIEQPADYDPARYELLLRVLEKKPANSLGAFLKIDRMPNHKTDINNNGPFSTDMIGMSYDYPEADMASRKKITEMHDRYVKGLLYFIGHDPRIPEHLRREMLNWGYPKDEYPDNHHWSPQTYVREARRMVGAYVMTQANCEGREVVSDGIAMAAYTMDSHNCERLVVNGMVKNEGDVQIGGFGPYPVSYRALIPRAGECGNLLVPVCLSASHIAYGSIRMEPVFMVLGQAAATAAADAIAAGVDVQHVDVSRLRQELKENPLANGSTAEIVVDNADEQHVQVKGNWITRQHIGFGPSALVSQAPAGDSGYVRFTPEIGQAGFYKVYSYFLPNYEKATSQTIISVYDGSTETKLSIKKAAIDVQGQTSGEWVFVGRFKLPVGSRAHVTVGTEQANGTVVADAILFMPDGAGMRGAGPDKKN